MMSIACSKPFHWLTLTFQIEVPQYGPQPIPRHLPATFYPHHPTLQPGGPAHCLPPQTCWPCRLFTPSPCLTPWPQGHTPDSPQCLLPAGSRLPLSVALPYLTGAHFTGVCARLEALPGLILPTLMLTGLAGVGWGVKSRTESGSFQAGSNARPPSLREWGVHKNGGHFSWNDASLPPSPGQWQGDADGALPPCPRPPTPGSQYQSIEGSSHGAPGEAGHRR